MIVSNGHCCVCSRVCMHVSPPTYCALHSISLPEKIESYQPRVTTTGFTFTKNEDHIITIEPVENGWIVEKDGKTYVMTAPEQIVDFLRNN